MSKVKILIEMDEETYNLTRLHIGYWLSNPRNRRTKYPYGLYLEFYEDKRIGECDDAVSRQAVLEVLNKYGKFIFVTDNPQYTDMVDEMTNIPSVLPKRKQGEWCEQNDDYFDWYECSECGYGSEGEMQYSSERDVRTKYCPNCGAEMR